MKIKLAIMMAAVLITAGTGVAQTTTFSQTTTTTTTQFGLWNNHWCNPGGDKYTAGEASLDFFGSYIAGQRRIEDLFKTNIRHGDWGGGVGLNYFFVKELGIGGDINIPNDGGNFVNNIDGSLIARFPIENTGIAPYIYGGGGRQTQPEWVWTGHLGVGLEFRFNAIAGVFVDARYMWVDKTPDELLFRSGLRFVF